MHREDASAADAMAAIAACLEASEEVHPDMPLTPGQQMLALHDFDLDPASGAGLTKAGGVAHDGHMLDTGEVGLHEKVDWMQLTQAQAQAQPAHGAASNTGELCCSKTTSPGSHLNACHRHAAHM
jgi:hypothetical protein